MCEARVLLPPPPPKESFILKLSEMPFSAFYSFIELEGVLNASVDSREIINLGGLFTNHSPRDIL